MNKLLLGIAWLSVLTPAAVSAQSIFGSGFEDGEGPPASFALRITAALIDTNANGISGDAGDQIAYAFTAENTGAVALADVVVDAEVVGPPAFALDCTISGPLAVAATASCNAALYTITTADSQAGRVRVTALGVANGSAAPPVSKAWDVVVASSSTVNSGLGINLEAVEDFSVAYPFADFMKQSRPWFTANGSVFDTGNADQLDLDADGWVQSLPSCGGGSPFCFARTVFNSSGAPWPDGTYVVCYEGNGSIRYSGGASLQSSGSSAACPRRDVIDVTGNSIWIMTIEATGPAPNHIRNIRVLPPGIAEDNTPVFHPDFLAELAPYRAIRFMDWARTNGDGFNFPFDPNPIIDIDDMAQASDAQWTGKAGIPLTVMIELANETGAEPWLTIPHQASDVTVAEYARIVRNNLAAGRTVYVEHSNEIWNNFPQGNATTARGTALFGNVATAFERRLNAHGLRTAQICDIFRAEFGAEAGRIVCTLGAQAANSFTADEAARCPLAQAAGLRVGNCLRAGDAIAIAPYFANYLDVENNEDEVALWTLDDLFDDVIGDWDLNTNTGSPSTGAGVLHGGDASSPCTDNFPQTPLDGQGRCPISALEEIDIWLAANDTVAQNLGLRLLAYEGGQHLTLVNSFSQDPVIQARKDAVVALFSDANRDARMGEIYQSYLENWKAKGGELFSLFNLSFGYGRFGNWGIVERLGQSPRPAKAQAIDNFNAANPCWYPACTPGNSTPVDPGPDPGSSADLSISVVLNTTGPFESGDTVNFGISVQNAGPDAASNLALTFNPVNLGNVVFSGACNVAACNVANLAPGNTVNINVTASIVAAGAFSLAANITDAEQSDPDSSDRNAVDGDSATAPVVTGCPSPQLLSDSELENSNGGPWTAVSQQFGNGLCHVSFCADSVNPASVGPNGGGGWSWLGGAPAPNDQEVSSMSQSVVLPDGASLQLNFMLRIGFVLAPFNAKLELRVDDTVVATFNEPITAEAGYSLRSVDLSSFADGQTHSIRFDYDNPSGSGKSNYNVDDVSLSCVD